MALEKAEGAQRSRGRVDPGTVSVTLEQALAKWLSLKKHMVKPSTFKEYRPRISAPNHRSRSQPDKSHHPLHPNGSQVEKPRVIASLLS